MVPITPFQFVRMPEIYFGNGKIADLPLLINSQAKKILLITGKSSFLNSGAYEQLSSNFQKKGIHCFQESIVGEPSPAMVDRIVSLYKKENVDWVVGIGGGSVLDGAKAISAMLLQNSSVVEYLEGRQTKKHDGRKVPFIAVPTSAGTGSEATKNAVLSEISETGFKNSLRHDNFVPDIALIDPELMCSCPASVTAACGLDALTQLLEAYVSTKASPITDALALSGIEHFSAGFIRALECGTDVNARAHMAHAALMSGICLANAGLGAVHGFAGPIGGFFDIPHGVVCGTLVGEVTRLSIELALQDQQKYQEPLKKYANVGVLLTGGSSGRVDIDAQNLCKILERWINETNIPTLGQFGVQKIDFSKILDKTDCKNSSIVLDREVLERVLSARL